jgi:hypothetical protein
MIITWRAGNVLHRAINVLWSADCGILQQQQLQLVDITLTKPGTFHAKAATHSCWSMFPAAEQRTDQQPKLANPEHSKCTIYVTINSCKHLTAVDQQPMTRQMTLLSDEVSKGRSANMHCKWDL